MSFSTLVYIGPELASYGFGNNHPFGPHRMGVFWEEAKRQGLADQVEVFIGLTSLNKEMETAKKANDELTKKVIAIANKLDISQNTQ